MLNIFKKKPQGTSVVFNIDGMHCTSCSMNIDGELEDVGGVVEAKTSYAKAKTTVVYDPAKVKVEELRKTIEKLEYQATEVS